MASLQAGQLIELQPTTSNVPSTSTSSDANQKIAKKHHKIILIKDLCPTMEYHNQLKSGQFGDKTCACDLWKGLKARPSKDSITVKYLCVEWCVGSHKS
jgi:hypothetical protein